MMQNTENAITGISGTATNKNKQQQQQKPKMLELQCKLIWNTAVI